MLGADTGVVETGGDGVGLLDLAILVLQQVRASAVQHARPSGREGTRVLARQPLLTASLYANDLHRLVPDEGVEEANGVGPTAHARHDRVRELARLLHELSAGLLANNGLEVTNDGGEGVRSDGGTDDVVRVARWSPSRASPR